MKLQRIIAYHKKENAYKERFTGTDWRFIITYLEQLDDFPKCLSTRCPLLSIDELRLCYLLKLDLSVIEISIIIERTRDSVYKKIPVIMNKLGVDESNTPLKVVLETISYF